MFQSDLVELCKSNDRQAQMKLYNQYSAGMYNVAMRFLQNSDDAEDVLQESFIKAFQKIHQFRGEVTFGAWLKRIVINKSIDFLKGQRQKFVELQEHSLRVAGDDDWEVEDGINVQDVKSSIEKLSDKYRFVVQLYLIEGYDHQEISQILKIPETTCRTRLLRGKTMLKELLTHQHYGTGS